MSMDLLKAAFEAVQQASDWSLLLLKISSSKQDGTEYASRQIQLKPEGELDRFVGKLAQQYLSTGKKSLDTYTEITDYDGTADGMKIYKLSSENSLISSEYESFISALADADVEADAMAFRSASVLKGIVRIDGNCTPIKLISMQTPITSLKHKFSFIRDTGSFVEISGPVLSLRSSIDVVVLRDVVYFLTLAGENLFNMARSYKAVCQRAILEVEQAGFISGIEVFKNIAGSGHNPRRFISFDYDRLKALENKNVRKSIAKQFSIPLGTEDKFDASVNGSAEKIVKLLCKKGMLDPFLKSAVEVTGAKKWQ